MNICLILGLLCLVYGLTVAIAGSGGTKFFIVWIGIAVILFALAGLFHMGIWDRIPQMIRWISGILCGVFFLSFLVIEGMVIRQMHAQGEKNLDYVIVLGAQVHADKPSVVLKYRLDEAILYLNENPETVCIVAGGQGKNEPYSEAYGMAQYLMQNGIDKERILLEDQSKTTEENLRFSRKFLPENAKSGSSRMIFICSVLCRSPKNRGSLMYVELRQIRRNSIFQTICCGNILQRSSF